MKTVKNASGSTSAATHPTRRGPREPPRVDEGEFLDRQAREAKAAALQTAHGILKDIGRLADPRSWVTQHPWISAASGIGLGFLAGVALTPKSGETFRGKFRRMAGKAAAGEEDERIEERRVLRSKLREKGADRKAEGVMALLSDFSYLGLAKVVIRAVSRIAAIGMAISRKKAEAAAMGGDGNFADRG